VLEALSELIVEKSKRRDRNERSHKRQKEKEITSISIQNQIG